MNQTAILSAVLAAIVGGLAGFFAARSTEPAPLPEPGAAASPQLAAMLVELRALRRDLTAVPAASGRPTEPGAPDRETLQRTASRDDVVLAELRNLRTRIDQVGAVRAAESGVLRQLVHSRVRDERALTELVRIRNDDFDRAQQEAFLLSTADVLQRYGKPDRASAGASGVRWEYDFGTDDDRHWLGLTFVDGMVVRVE
jgi:hypothetical protein